MKWMIFPLCAIATCMVIPKSIHGQCVLLENAAAGITLTASPGGTDNRSGIAFDPGNYLYHSVNAGNPDYPCDTYDASGTLVNSIAQGFDHRGAWWNPATSQFEGNGFSTFGLFVHTLNTGSGFPTGTGTTIAFPQPNEQSIGELDTDANEVIHYFLGAIHRYSRATGDLAGTLPLVDVLVGYLNTNSVAYTGCPGFEYGVYDFVNRQVILIDKATGEVSGTSQLPPSAPARSTFGMSYENDLFWLFENGVWYSYSIFEITVGASENAASAGFNLFPVPADREVRMTFNDPMESNSTIELIDMAGRIVHSDRIPEGSIGHQLDVAAFPSGAYQLRLTGGKGSNTKPLLITH